MAEYQIMNPQDAPSARKAECYVTKGNQRFNVLSGIDFEANINIKNAEVKSIGRFMTGHKSIGTEGKFKMKIYKCTPLFTDIVMEFIKTGILPTFDIQVTSYDESTSIGRDTKIFKGCQLDGDVLVSAFNGDGEFIEQEVNGFFDSVEDPEDYHNPVGMM